MTCGFDPHHQHHEKNMGKFLIFFFLSKVSTFLPIEVNTVTSSTLYYCDFLYYNTSTRYPLRGGTSRFHLYCGAFYLSISNYSVYAGLNTGAVLSFKHIEVNTATSSTL